VRGIITYQRYLWRTYLCGRNRENRSYNAYDWP